MPMPKKPRRNCLNCGQKLNRPEKFYCNNKCQREKDYNDRISKVRKTNLWTSGWDTSYRIRAALINEIGQQCSVCKRTDWEGKPIPVVMDHIDGNSDNWHTDNLRLVCGNCDMQLPTYKSKNKGNGRHSRIIRYKKGKSY